MKPLTLTLKTSPAQRVDMSPLTPDGLRGLNTTAIGRVKLQSGNRRIAVNDLFALAGANPEEIVIRKSNTKLDNIGAGMTLGAIAVEGNTGHRTGAEMRAGTLTVHGNTADWAGTGMYGGTLIIRGNAGRCLGAAWPGDAQGMRNGTIVVAGDVGERAGDRMRRGTIVVEGDAGDYCGSRMISGSIVVCGEVGEFVGHAMRRGTILLTATPRIPATFNDCGSYQFGFLPLLVDSLGKSSRRVAALSKRAQGRTRRYAGDLGNGGKGELMVLR